MLCAVGSLLLRVKSNLHVIHDDESAARSIGVGLYPAAAMINHACSPCACLSSHDDGRVLHVRAIADLIPAGDEVTVSYLAEEHLYAPWAERRALLRDGFGYEPDGCPVRLTAEQATLQAGAPSDALIRRARDAIGDAKRALANDSTRGDEAADALERLSSLVATELQGALHPFHWLTQEVQAARLALARMAPIDEPRLIAECALHLIAGREALLPSATLHLAALYASHGSALCRVLREGVPPDERTPVVAAAVKSLNAACALRSTCLGEGHALTKATSAAVRHAREALG